VIENKYIAIKMVHCAVFGCNNNNKKTQKFVANKTSHISYYTFPQDPGLIKEWVVKYYRADKFNAKFARICSIHFCEQDFERNLRNELLNITYARKVLKKGAIPSLNLPKFKPFKSTEILNQRAERKSRRENKLVVPKLL